MQRAVILCCLAPAFYSGAARAETMLDFGLELEAPADAECTPAVELQRSIEARIDRLVFLDNAEPRRRIRVSITQDVAASAWSAQIVMRDDRGVAVGERHITANATGCGELDEALVVVISTLIGIADPVPKPAADAQADTPPQPGSTHAAHEPGPNRELGVADRAGPSFTHEPPSGAPSAHLEVAASASARAELGLLPGVAPGVALAVDFDFGTWGLLLGTTLLPHASLDLGAGAAAGFRALSGEARLCWDAARPLGARLGFCAGAQAGAIEVSTSGLESPVVRVEPWVSAVIGPQLRVPIVPRVGIVLGIAAAIPLLSPRYFLFDANGQRQFYHSVELGVSGQLGAYWLFSS